MVLMTPTSISSTGTGNSSSIGANGSVTFSSCATLSLNGVFTSSYDNYMIVVGQSATASGTGAEVRYRMRSSGADDSTASSYVTEYLIIDGTGESSGRTTTTNGYLSQATSTIQNGFTAYFYGPYLAQPTASRSVTMVGISSAYIYDLAGTHNQSTSYDGLTIIAQSGTFTGLVAVYGLEN